MSSQMREPSKRIVGRDDDVFTLVELASQYVAIGGTDPRAKLIVEAGKKAGHLNEMGIYTGPVKGDRNQSDMLLSEAGMTGHEIRDLCKQLGITTGEV